MNWGVMMREGLGGGCYEEKVGGQKGGWRGCGGVDRKSGVAKRGLFARRSTLALKQAS